MRLVLVVGVLMAAQAFAQSLPGQQVSQVVLLRAEDGAKSITLPPPPPAVTAAQLPDDPFASLHRRIVTMQLQLLEFHRVSLAGPLALTIIGGSAFVIGISLMLLSVGVGYGAFIVGLVMLIGSALPLLAGLPWLIGSVSANAKVDQEAVRLRTELRQLGDLRAQRIEPLEGVALAVF